METETEQGIVTEVSERKSLVFRVTPFSKYLAMILFIAMPFIGGWVGYTNAPERIVEVERIIVKEIPIQVDSVGQYGFKVGQNVSFSGVVGEYVQDCGGGETCITYLTISLPKEISSNDIESARIDVVNGNVCFDSALRSGDIVAVAGKILSIDEYAYGLIFSCNEGVQVERSSQL